MRTDIQKLHLSPSESTIQPSAHLDNCQAEKLKRPPNAYLLFNRDMRRRLLKFSPQLTVAEISKEIGEAWKALPQKERQLYVDEASSLKQEHRDKYPNLIYNRRTKAELAEAKKSSKYSRRYRAKRCCLCEEKHFFKTLSTADAQTTHQSTTAQVSPSASELNVNQCINCHCSSGTSVDGRKASFNNQKDPRGRKKKKLNHPFAPKHPMSAYLFYLASVYTEVSTKFPGATVGPISKSISKTWHAMTPEERSPWKRKAELDKARYAREMQEYMARKSNS